MSKHSVACAVVLTTLVAGVPHARQPPDFGGRWIPMGGGSQPAQPLVVRQSATSLSVENWSTSGPRSGIYAWSMDSRVADPATPNASWSGNTLVVVFPAARPIDPLGVATVRTESWSLDPAGRLTVVITLTREKGAPLLVDRILYSRSDSR